MYSSSRRHTVVSDIQSQPHTNSLLQYEDTHIAVYTSCLRLMHIQSRLSHVRALYYSMRTHIAVYTSCSRPHTHIELRAPSHRLQSDILVAYIHTHELLDTSLSHVPLHHRNAGAWCKKNLSTDCVDPHSPPPQHTHTLSSHYSF